MKSPELYPCASFLSKGAEKNHIDDSLTLMSLMFAIPGTPMDRENKKDETLPREQCP
jgi:hypothetical protein